MDIDAQIIQLLSSVGKHVILKSITPLFTGGNNRIYKIQSTAGMFIVKHYFQHSNDDRDRMGNEFAFLSYAAIAAPGITPRVLSKNTEAGLAMYEYISGVPIEAKEITKSHLEAAAHFFIALNDPNYRSLARLRNASEACFSIEAHLNLIDQRLEKLSMLDHQVPEDLMARDFIDSIIVHWDSIKRTIYAGANAAHIDSFADLPLDQRCISPSDFGFHNALQQADGSLKFFDFEYAGWDDPAKMAGDFFAQLAVPVPSEFFDEFVNLCFDNFPNNRQLIQRAQLLLLAYKMKWCCIALNVFLPINLARRKFANPNLDERSLKCKQLNIATRLFQSIF